VNRQALDHGLAQVRAWCKRCIPDGNPTGPLVVLPDDSILWPQPVQDDTGRWLWEIVHESALDAPDWVHVYPV
jgi:hypothetical protein